MHGELQDCISQPHEREDATSSSSLRQEREQVAIGMAEEVIKKLKDQLNPRPAGATLPDLPLPLSGHMPME